MLLCRARQQVILSKFLCSYMHGIWTVRLVIEGPALHIILTRRTTCHLWRMYSHQNGQIGSRLSHTYNCRAQELPLILKHSNDSTISREERTEKTDTITVSHSRVANVGSSCSPSQCVGKSRGTGLLGLMLLHVAASVAPASSATSSAVSASTAGSSAAALPLAAM